ncbi:zf-HC2 domain-containing protein [Planomonospora sp. ID67723]|uniref:anti-sigma factor family protein n=1 Tax=Planomonospora sp. ID67723 TaxID=2738134 RepID=UPI0018C3D036|nr:zf-HC2 domain-containing protein [Planomonospora sp. ID67723]MBG0827571.1 zf-HC2 domain-containing protein [Planomonospora sp. ID67723]
MTMTCEEARISLGVHVLGALEPEERVLVEAHLEECAECRAELAELTGVAGFLGRVSEDDVAQVASPPRAVLDRLLRAKARRRRMTRALLSLAASVVVIGLGGTFWMAADQSADEPKAASAPQYATDSGGEARSLNAPEESPVLSGDATREFKASPSDAPKLSASPAPEVGAVQGDPGELVAKDAKGPVRATVTAVPGEKATAVEVVLSGVARGTRFRLVVVGADGSRETAGNWIVDEAANDESGVFPGTTTIHPGSIERFEIVTAGGRVLLDVRVPGR